MSKYQYALIVAAVSLFAILYFGFSTKNSKQRTNETANAISGESTSIETLMTDAQKRLTPEAASEINVATAALAGAKTADEKKQLLKRLSGLWYKYREIPAAASLAEEVAVIENSDSAWSVAGALYFDGLTASKDSKIRDFCAGRAIKSFESAASIKPDQVSHRVNLALVYAENPPPDNPMKAVLMLRELEQKYPNEVSVYNALGRLAIKTGQWQRAIERLEKARTLDPKNPNAPCLLAKAYQGAGMTDKANEMNTICEHNNL